MPDNKTQLKQQAAAMAVSFITSGMVVGLGTGSTTRFAIDLLGQKLQSGELDAIVGIPTSEATAAQARGWGIPLANLADYPQLDLAIDGADEVTPELSVTKGWGGALVREKLVEMHARRFVVIVDESKLVDRLGSRGPIPVEVIPFSWEVQAHWLAQTLQCTVTRREDDGQPYVTDNHNYILNCLFAGGIDNPHGVDRVLAGRTGLVGHGLFLDMVTEVVVATPQAVTCLRRPQL